jgi:predicted nucleic acid-binding Zn ribbon protein
MGFKRVGDILASVIRDLDLEKGIAEHRAILMWEEAVGSEAASHAVPREVARGRMIAAVDSSAWLQELRMREHEIIEKINKLIGEDVLKEIYFTIGGEQR